MTRESDRALRRALRPAPGMVRLVLLRESFLLVCALPGMLGAFSSLARGAARQPYFTEAVRPLPALPFVRLVGEIAPSLLALLGVGLLCALLVDQLLTAGGLALLGPESANSRPRFGLFTLAMAMPQ